jgi:hypothetical protein
LPLALVNVTFERCPVDFSVAAILRVRATRVEKRIVTRGTEPGERGTNVRKRRMSPGRTAADEANLVPGWTIRTACESVGGGVAAVRAVVVVVLVFAVVDAECL